jgi:hypothetical protein
MLAVLSSIYYHIYMVSESHSSTPGTNEKPSASSPQAEILGRIAEFDRLAVLAQDTISGAGAVALICGEAGIGKTRLAEELVDFATESGMRSLWGRCVEDSSAPPLWPWEQALRHVVEEDTRLAIASPPEQSGSRGSVLNLRTR